MKKLNDFWFGVLFCASICLVCYCFIIANAQRESVTVGGEVFTIALPLLVAKWKLHTVEQEKSQCRKTIHRLNEQLRTKITIS